MQRIFSSVTPTKIIIILALLASLLSFAKSDHCRNNGWASPDVDVHACYSDIPSLFSARGLDLHHWAYSSGEKSVEYPVITGVVMWATAWMVASGKHSTRNYFDLNIFLLSLLFIGTLLVTFKLNPRYSYLLALSPAVIGSLFINWDLWGIFSMMLAIHIFDKNEINRSAALLAVSISTKFFPVLLVLPIIFILWRRNEIRSIVKYSSVCIAVWLTINLPVIITTPQGWWHFYQLNLQRESDWGSVWYALSLLGLNISALNYISVLLLLAVSTAMVIYLLELSRTPKLAEVSFLLLAAVLIVGKVYSPQYVLWLVPLAVIALQSKKELLAFWVWQAGEAIYHVAIWQHLALVSGSHFGLPDAGYACLTLVRIATCLYFMGVLMKNRLSEPPPQAGDSHSRIADFLFGSASSYP